MPGVPGSVQVKAPYAVEALPTLRTSCFASDSNADAGHMPEDLAAQLRAEWNADAEVSDMGCKQPRVGM